MTTIVDFNNESTVDPSGAFVFRGKAQGSLGGSAAMVEITPEENTSWHLVLKNKSAPEGSVAGFAYGANGGLAIAVTGITTSEIYFEEDGTILLIPDTKVQVDGALQVQGNVGFYSRAPVAKPIVTGIKIDPVASSILAALVAVGLVADETT